MIKQENSIYTLLAPVVTAMGYELWGIEKTGAGEGTVLRVYIDCESGISLEDCERVSHQIAGLLETRDPFPGKYTLEVSSPGLDRPLFVRDQYARYTGFKARVRIHGKLQGRKQITGKITAVGEDTVTIVENGENYTIPLALIDRGNLVYQSSGQ